MGDDGEDAPVLQVTGNPEARSSPECTRAIDHRRRVGRDVVGVREYEDPIGRGDRRGRVGRRTA